MREHILALLAHKPFLPFRIYLTDRSVHEIRGPEFAEVRESVMDLKEPDPDAPGGMSWRCTLALRHVVSIEVPMDGSAPPERHARDNFEAAQSLIASCRRIAGHV